MTDQWVLEQDDDQIIGAYHKWLHKMANVYLDPTDERHDDLVQEGRIAMWKALQTWDPERVALPTWLTGAAKLRMKDVAFGHGRDTGHEALRGTQHVEPVTSIDAFEDPDVLLSAGESLEGVELAYHYGEIYKALEDLSPAQRRYVYARFWLGLDPTSRKPEMRELVAQVPELAERWHWQRARERLRESLAHLSRT